MKRAIVIGGGHAGIEAALALSRMNIDTTLITGDLKRVATLPCNPSIGGPAKGIVVREIDALGGQMGKSADLASLQIKMLNSSKGPAVRALRAQIDKVKYPLIMLDVLKKTKNLTLVEGYVNKLIIDNMVVKGVVLENGKEIDADAVVVTTGTYLRSKILIGSEVTESGPNNERTTLGISEQLSELGFDVIRLKTGTPPRLRKDSVYVEHLKIQRGDENPKFFSQYTTLDRKTLMDVPCFLTYTSQLTHDIVNENLKKSAMYSGNIKGVGPRYCPSIEDKIVRFKEKERHQIFLEPESLEIDEYYVQGVSTSMPRDIQEKIIHSIPGLESAIINRYAYAIEYDAVNPLELYPFLETKKVSGLFLAGQINGTSGYEEAAGQGIMAGINAALKLQGEKPLILKRSEAYIGVLIDDLVTKGTKEPYRLLTSRAEYRLLLRHDNADLRLTRYGHDVGLINNKQFKQFENKEKTINDLIEYTKKKKITPSKENNVFLRDVQSSEIKEPLLLFDLIKRPEISIKEISFFLDEEFDIEVLEQVELQIKYGGYIQKAIKDAEKLIRLENKQIPSEVDYTKIVNISSEAREKLNRIKPLTIGQASRILGVNPTDVMILSIYIETGEYKK